MKLFEVYSLYPIEPVRGKGAIVFDAEGREYLDFYGGHAVISVGHTHPYYVKSIKDQLDKIGFYSNAVINSLQQELADKLEAVSGLKGYDLFLCNSGAEANENALKLASFHNGRTRVLALENGFHGRTSAAVRVTHNLKIQAPINQGTEISYLPINDLEAFEKELAQGDVTAVIIEAIQGIGGCHVCSPDFLQGIAAACAQNGAYLIMDEVQCGYGRSGRFFGYQYATDIEPDVITMAKGMGNGFPIGGILINNKKFTAKPGMLGTTFGGSHLACAAGIAVLDIIKDEGLVEKAAELGEYFRKELNRLPEGKVKLLGRGLMIGIDFGEDSGPMRKKMLFEHRIFTGSSGNPNIMRILPPLNINKEQINYFVKCLQAVLAG